MTTVRLPDYLEYRLEEESLSQQISKSELVREALVQYFTDADTERSSWELGEGLFGRYGSGDGNLSTSYKERLRDKINAKNYTH
jgi:Arc/MetJ-type ribon-helix-helix transcriptional regulator